MAIGDDAQAAGYPLVPPNGEEGKAKWGYREFNRTRDFIAQLRNLIPGSKSAYRTAAGLTSGNGAPSNLVGEDGDWYLRMDTPGLYVKTAGVWQKYL